MAPSPRLRHAANVTAQVAQATPDKDHTGSSGPGAATRSDRTNMDMIHVDIGEEAPAA